MKEKNLLSMLLVFLIILPTPLISMKALSQQTEVDIGQELEIPSPSVPLLEQTSQEIPVTHENPNIQLEPNVEHFTIIARGKEAYIFEITIERPVFEQSTSTEVTNKINDVVKLTEEQKTALTQANNVTIILGEIQEGENQSYVVVTDLWILGATVHLYLTATDAINLETALCATILLLGVATGLLIETIIPAIVTGVITYAVSIFELDYHVMYNADHNPDGSFDALVDVTFFSLYLNGCLYVRTNRYLWLATPVGAYIIGPRGQQSYIKNTKASGLSPAVRMEMK